VAAALGTLRATGLGRALGPPRNRCRDLVIAMIVARLAQRGTSRDDKKGSLQTVDGLLCLPVGKQGGGD